MSDIGGKNMWQTADHQEKPVCPFLPASPVEEQTGGEKLLVPVTAASQITISWWQTAHQENWSWA
jgi:hypothetical protein